MSKTASGDVVQLKSGGPPMTVETVEEYVEGRKARCTWFVGPELKTALINVEALEPVREPIQAEQAQDKLTVVVREDTIAA